MLRRWRGRGEAGSGMVIGVAIIFPMLMLVIVALQMLSDSARIEQGIQSSANRAARSASMCCYDTDAATEVAEASLRAAESADAHNRIHCGNDFVSDSTVVFVDLNGDTVPISEDAAVPPGGTVHVFVTCRLPNQVLGGFSFGALDVKRIAEGVASIDPYRFRAGA